MAETRTERGVPEGCKLEWVPEDDSWSIGGYGRKCRMRGCSKDAVAILWRGLRRNYPWSYCENHLYGRKIEDGVVKVQRLVEIEEVSRG